MYGDFPARNTACTPYLPLKCMVLANPIYMSFHPEVVNYNPVKFKGPAEGDPPS